MAKVIEMENLSEIMKTYHSIEISNDVEQILYKYLDLVIEKNHLLNLTRIDNRDEGVVLHLEDSLVGIPLIQKYGPAGTIADLGSGGGFPGVPIALETSRNTLLIDSVGKKMKAVSEILNEVGLEDLIQTSSDRIEVVGKDRRNKFSVVTARALSKMTSILELASPLLCKGGICICYKASPEREEIASVRRAQRQLGFENVSRETLSLSNGVHRELFVFRKVDEPHIKLPRRIGLAQHNPIA